MGAGILPTTIYNNKLYFLFGKENKYETSAPGFSDFGGGTDDKESYLETAIREGGEELTGFLGSDKDIKKMLKSGTYNIDNKQNNGHSVYRMHIFFMNYDPMLPYYYNNNQQFLQKHLDPDVIKNTKIFEKEEIKWICVDELQKMKSKFRSYFQVIVDKICSEKNEISKFITKKIKKPKNITIKRKYQ
jgi:transcription termination factor NusB